MKWPGWAWNVWNSPGSSEIGWKALAGRRAGGPRHYRRPFCILLPFDLLLGYRIGMVTEEWNQQNPFQAIQARLKQGLSKT